MTQSLSRRTLIRHASQLAAFGAVASLLEACGNTAASPTATTGAAATPLVYPTQVPQTFPTAAPTTGMTAAPSTAGSPVPTSASASPAATTAAAMTGGSGAVKDVSFTVVDGSEPNSLDPPVGTGPFGHILNAIYEGLVAWDEKMQLRPVLATAWHPSADGKQWFFTLRPGVKFHDGTPFTAEWGAMLSAGRNYLTSSPQLAAIPGLAILLVTIGFNLLGDGLRDALDPRLKR